MVPQTATLRRQTLAVEGDASLLALAPELEAASSACLAYDRDQHVTRADPDFDEAHRRYGELFGALRSVTDRIFAYRPTTLAGVLLTAHAASMRALATWDESPEHVDNDGMLLRQVCNGLFRMVGVDWRGRPLVGPDPAGEALTGIVGPAADAATRRRFVDEADRLTLPPQLSVDAPGTDDAELLALAPTLDEAAQALDYHRRTDTRDDGAMYDERRVLVAAVHATAERILAIRPRTVSGLLLTARAAATASDWLWDPEDEDAEREGLALRTVCDNLFALAGIDRFGRPVAASAGAVPDAELLALGRAFDDAFAAYLAFRPHELAAEDERAAVEVAHPDVARDRFDGPAQRARYFELAGEHEAAIERANDLRERADDPAEEAFRLPPPRTLGGLAVLARMLAGFHARLWDGPSDELEIDGRMLRATLEGTLAIAGVDRLGRPAGLPPASLTCRPTGAQDHPDAALLDLEPELLARMAIYHQACAEESRVEALIDVQAGTIPDPGAPDRDERVATVLAARVEFGFAAFERARDEAHEASHLVADRIRAIRPCTLDGLRVKAMTLKLRELDPDESLIADILAVAGTPPDAPLMMAAE